MKLTCTGCGGERQTGKYLCGDCWWLLRPWVRTALRKRDDRAMLRLQQVTRQIADGRPLEDIEVHL